MKTKIIIIALIGLTAFTSKIIAQEVVSKSVGYDLKKNVICRITPTETGFSIAFEHNVKAPAEVTVNEASGKKGYDYYQTISEYSVSSIDKSVTQIKGPKDVASGLATGKRQHQPIGVTKGIDKSTPILYKEATGNVTHEDSWSTNNRSGGGAGKVNMQDISLTKSCGGNSTVFIPTNGECVIPTDDYQNGVCYLKIEWTWNDGAVSTDIGSTGMDGVNRNSIDFSLTIEDGVCTAMAINEKGLPGEKSKKGKAKN